MARAVILSAKDAAICSRALKELIKTREFFGMSRPELLSLADKLSEKSEASNA